MKDEWELYLLEELLLVKRKAQTDDQHQKFNQGKNGLNLDTMKVNLNNMKFNKKYEKTIFDKRELFLEKINYECDS